MKTIHLREHATFPTAALIREVCNKTTAGLTIEDIRARLRVIDALEKCKGKVLLLEDADHATLQDAIKKMDGAWGVVSPEIVQFADDVAAALAHSPAPPI